MRQMLHYDPRPTATHGAPLHPADRDRERVQDVEKAFREGSRAARIVDHVKASKGKDRRLLVELLQYSTTVVREFSFKCIDCHHDLTTGEHAPECIISRVKERLSLTKEG